MHLGNARPIFPIRSELDEALSVEHVVIHSLQEREGLVCSELVGVINDIVRMSAHLQD